MQCSAAALLTTRSWRAASILVACSSTSFTSITGLPRSSRSGLTNERDASGPQYAAVPSCAAPASSAAPLIAPADEPTTRSKHGVSPSRSIVPAIAADTTPRIPPPSSTIATRCGSSRSPGCDPAAARSRSTSATG
jgi:hypothetical protein